MRINLKKAFFDDREFVLVETEKMKAVAFRFSTGVEALRIENTKGYIVVLPFKGQQIWRACFLGRELVMGTSFKEPVPTKEYLKTYGGFLLHCGATAMGSPGKGDSHPQHGELPNADYDSAYLECGEDYMEIGGCVEYNVSFVKHYAFSPVCRLGADATLIKVDAVLENLRHRPLEYMYLCHINFNTLKNSELIYSADYKNITVHKSAWDDIPPEQAEKLLSFMDRLEEKPELHHKTGATGETYDPEILFTIHGYKGDERGFAHTMQYSSEGAYYAAHAVDTMPCAIRWIARSEDEDSTAMVLPATAEPFGYTYAKEHGQIKVLAPLDSVKFSVEVGWLDKKDAEKMKEKIEHIN